MVFLPAFQVLQPCRALKRIKGIIMMRWLRRLSQVLFLGLFLLLFLQARYPYEPLLPVDFFLRASPLVALGTALSSRALPSLMIWPALLILLLTVIFGRVFCGWICPLGTTIDISDRLFLRARRQKKRDSLRFRSWKFAILVAVAATAFFSLQILWFFDPIALLTRTLTGFVYPAFVYLVSSLFDAGLEIDWMAESIYTLYDSAQQNLLPLQQPAFYGSMAIALFFFAILFLGSVSRRFWCRNLCPLGALLGIFAKYRFLRRTVSSECTACAVCQRRCRMNAIEDDFTLNSAVECIQCGECETVCKPQAISYRFGRGPQLNQIDLSRRRFLQAGVFGLVGVAAVKSTAQNRNAIGGVIRPPGSLPEAEYLDRCVRCLECVRICASTGGCLQPAGWQSGWEGLLSPLSIPRMGYCEYNCNLCGQVCPTGAIKKMPLPEKQHTKIGTAYFDRSRCIPWYSHENCLVCEEHCPLPEKAIRFDEKTVTTADGQVRLVKFPAVIEELCIGCGICENRCPVVGKPGIFVTAAHADRRS